jgi:predicted nucleic acid-binding protein
MTRAILVDSTPLYAIADSADAEHERAVRELAVLADDRRQIAIAYPTLLEAYTLILFRLGSNAAIRWLEQVAGAKFINPIPEDYQRAVEQVRAMPDQQITLVDAVTAAIARRLGLQVWTYDHHFEVMRAPVWR